MKCCLYIFVINELSNPIHASNELFVFVDACMSHDIENQAYYWQAYREGRMECSCLREYAYAKICKCKIPYCHQRNTKRAKFHLQLSVVKQEDCCQRKDSIQGIDDQQRERSVATRAISMQDAEAIHIIAYTHS